jgi:hypothetical protein
MSGSFPSSWNETALVSIQKLAGTAYTYQTVVETIDISEPDYPGESISSIAGGRVWKQSPQEDGEVTLELYPTSIDVGSAYGLFQEFAGGTVDSSQPLATDTAWAAGVSRARDRFLVAIMWTDDAAQTAATGATTTADAVALRFYAKECRLISHKADFTDGILKITATFKFPAMNQAGTTRCYAWESTNDGDGSSALLALTYSAAL